MGETTVNILPYPVDGDAPDGPAQIKALAEALDVLKWGSRNLKPTIGKVNGSGSVITLTASYADITNAKLEITPAVASTLLMICTFDLSVHANNSATTAQAAGTINVDGADTSSPLADLQELAPATSVVIGGTVSQTYAVALTAAAHTIKLRAKKVSGNEAACNPGNSGFLYALFAS